MSTERKEPVISNDAFDLTNRVKLTWRDIRDLSEASSALASDNKAVDTIDTATPPHSSVQTAAVRKLTEEEMKAIAAMIAPALEASIKAALKDTLEVSLHNASTRIRGDLDRSVASVVNESIRSELAKIDLKSE